MFAQSGASIASASRTNYQEKGQHYRPPNNHIIHEFDSNYSSSQNNDEFDGNYEENIRGSTPYSRQIQKGKELRQSYNFRVQAKKQNINNDDYIDSQQQQRASSLERASKAAQFPANNTVSMWRTNLSSIAREEIQNEANKNSFGNNVSSNKEKSMLKPSAQELGAQRFTKMKEAISTSIDYQTRSSVAGSGALAMSIEPKNNSNGNNSPAGFPSYKQGTITQHSVSVTQAITNEQLSTCPSSITYKNAGINQIGGLTALKTSANSPNSNVLPIASQNLENGVGFNQKKQKQFRFDETVQVQKVIPPSRGGKVQGTNNFTNQQKQTTTAANMQFTVFNQQFSNAPPALLQNTGSIPRQGVINQNKAKYDNNISLNNKQLPQNSNGFHGVNRVPTRGQDQGINASLNHQISLKNETISQIYNTSGMNQTHHGWQATGVGYIDKQSKPLTKPLQLRLLSRETNKNVQMTLYSRQQDRPKQGTNILCDDFDDVKFGIIPQNLKQESIKVRVQKDQRVAQHLQEEPTENLNLLFYNFNNSVAEDTVASSQQQNSPIKQQNKIRPLIPTAAAYGRDRLPTRDGTAVFGSPTGTAAVQRHRNHIRQSSTNCAVDKFPQSPARKKSLGKGMDENGNNMAKTPIFQKKSKLFQTNNNPTKNIDTIASSTPINNILEDRKNNLSNA